MTYNVFGGTLNLALFICLTQHIKGHFGGDSFTCMCVFASILSLFICQLFLW